MSNNFSLVRSDTLPSLGAKTSYYRHQSTGSEHFHLHLPGGENTFMVAFRTLPEDSSGVAHVLEHTALCGSNRFPVRDPFFMMLRRSINSFMNAMTSSDWTAYPFSTRCEDDYWNLMQVYLDAAFFPLLDALDFAQEGHHMKFTEPDNPASDLEWGGVVFNEMKGAMSSPASLLWQGMTRHLCQGSTYQYNSGGDPDDILKLRHEDLVAFHQRYYRPGNTIFMTAGDIPPERIQQKIAELVLDKAETDRALPPAIVTSAPRWSKPKIASDAYPADAGDHAVTAWLLPRSESYADQLLLELMTSLLLGSAASPLRQALESSGLGSGLAPVTGLYSEQKDIVFACGIEQVSRKDIGAVHELIDSSLQQVVQTGVPQNQIAAALQKLEFSNREITGDHMPFGLELLLEGLPSLIYGENPEPVLDPTEELQQLRLAAGKKDFLPQLVQQMLLDNPHRLRYSLQADDGLLEQNNRNRQKLLTSLKEQMSDEELRAVQRQQAKLAEHQSKTDDPEILPRVGPEHISPELQLPEKREQGGAVLYEAATNGISYLQMSFALPELSAAEIAVLPFYCTCIGNLGVGERDYAATLTERMLHLGGLRAGFHSNFKASGEQQVWVSLSAEALNRSIDALTELSFGTLHDLRLDELDRIDELYRQSIAARQRAIPGSGHQLAMQAAQARLSPLSQIGYHSTGLAGLQRMATDEAMQSPARLAELLKGLHRKVLAASWRTALVSDKDGLQRLQNAAEAASCISEAPLSDRTALKLPAENADSAWLSQLAVNYCAQSLPAPASQHADAPALSVLALLLRNRYLHTQIREQGGAYGAGATNNPAARCFSFFSYRDPLLQKTFETFATSGKLLDENLKGRALEEAILGQISAIDKVGSPAGEALGSFQRYLTGRTDEQLRDYRARILAVSEEDLRRVCRQYLSQPVSRCALSSERERRSLEQMGFQVSELKLTN